MPGFRTHYIFGKRAELSHIDAVGEHPNVYALGQQGPDIFFYYPPSHFLFPENVGIVMHKTGARAFFSSLMAVRSKLKTASSRKIADAYIMGFMGHYTLDTIAHPYVHYRTKKSPQGDKETNREMYRFGIHVLLETDIDAAVLKHEFDITPTQFNSESTIHLSCKEMRVVTKLLNRAIHRTYPDLSIHAWQIGLAVHFTRLAQRLMHDESGFRKVMMRRIDKLIYGSAVFSSLIANDGFLTYEDPCNLRHRTWSNVWDPSFSSSKDFYEIMEEAKKIYLRRVETYREMNASKRKARRHLHHRLMEDLGDRSYDSGLENSAI